MQSPYRYAYLHGFASSSLSRKGVYLSQVFRNRGLSLALPDLNTPSFERMTYGEILDAVDEMDAAAGGAGYRWRLIGSSMGGYITARWAQLRPDRVDRVVLLCPGFDMTARWPELIGKEALQRWESTGSLELPDATGKPRPVHWGFVAEARTHPPFPELPCPGLILHGNRDEVVDVNVSRAYVRERPWVELIELDDDHSLAASQERIARESLAFFGVGEARGD
jgi:pimeloyl-ACP methyl ester carboxylesterase